ncbi:hypothetical protein ACIQAS_07875 [Bacillus safensis]|uniref:hypothetical protein n=1 Tax=Bacillus safensis TaxID=561879 RepID=UPI00382C0FB5
MKYRTVWMVMVLSFFFDPASLQAAEAGHNRVLVVDQKRSGAYSTVQSAIDAIPAKNQQPATIYIKKWRI